MVILVIYKTNKNSNSKISIFISEDILNKIIYFNYNRINGFNDNYIDIDNFIIKGDRLSISKLEDNIIEIFGNIEEIRNTKKQ